MFLTVLFLNLIAILFGIRPSELGLNFSMLRLLLSCSCLAQLGTARVPEGGGVGGALPSNGLLGMCRWMGSHFTTGLTIMGSPC